MNDPNANFAAMIEVMVKVKAHPMCAKFGNDGTAFVVIYPAGDFAVDGVRVNFAKGKRKALEILLDKMERHWAESYPASR